MYQNSLDCPVSCSTLFFRDMEMLVSVDSFSPFQINLSSELLSMCIHDLITLTGKILSRPSFNNAGV